ncbi:unnamed protein product [Schistocephalus solidus]|uniref:PDEase domain-containing protein n=1 Tax=Schistocephalus solidus TaxID=70667 RepID=A0A183TFQ1_SCHSO|nr:unnamed protein product [Schistocephalus solidus]
MDHPAFPYRFWRQIDLVIFDAVLEQNIYAAFCARKAGSSPFFLLLAVQKSQEEYTQSTYLKSPHSNESSEYDCLPIRPTPPATWSRSGSCCLSGCGGGVGMVSCGLCCRNKLTTVSEDEPCVDCAAVPCTYPVVIQVAGSRLMNQPACNSRRQFRPSAAPFDEHPANKSLSRRDSVDTSAPAVPLIREPVDPFASFVADLESAMAHCDVDNPGSRTGAPPSPNLASIRRSHEACLPVWREFFQSRNQPLSSELREDLTKPSFNNWPWSDAQLMCFVRHFFVGEGESDERLHLAQACGLTLDTLDTWLCAVYSYYNSVPFHNFKHAFMVTQMFVADILTRGCAPASLKVIMAAFMCALTGGHVKRLQPASFVRAYAFPSVKSPPLALHSVSRPL